MNNTEPSSKHVNQSLANISHYNDIRKSAYRGLLEVYITCLQQQGVALGVKDCLKYNATSFLTASLHIVQVLSELTYLHFLS